MARAVAFWLLAHEAPEDHGEANQSAVMVRMCAEAADIADGVAAPLLETWLESIVGFSDAVRRAWRGQATCESFALRFDPAL